MREEEEDEPCQPRVRPPVGILLLMGDLRDGSWELLAKNVILTDGLCQQIELFWILIELRSRMLLMMHG